MNESKRNALRQAAELLDRASGLIYATMLRETAAMDNVPENLQETERFSAMENGVEEMEDAIQSIRDAKECLDRASA